MRLLSSLCAVGLLLTSSTLNAGAVELRISEWHKAYGPGFEIQNKGDAIWVGVVINSGLKDFFKLDKSSKKSIEITGDENILVGVYKKEPSVNPRGFAANTFLGSQPDLSYDLNARGKTKYLTWNPAKFNAEAKYFYPQTGKFLGLLGTSESGFSLGKNIIQSEIRLLK